MNEREVRLLLDARAVKQVQVHYAVMAQGYTVSINGRELTTLKRETRHFATLDSAARCLFKLGVADFSVKLNTVL